MFPTKRVAGIAGIVAGIGLGIEFALFMASGWTPGVFADPGSALSFLESGGDMLRAAGFVGFVNLGFMVVFLAGLAGALRGTAPSRAATALYLGLVGVAAHALVPVGLWLAPPTFLELAATQPSVAHGAWGGFAAFLDAAGGVGYLFDGVAFAAAGSAIIAIGSLPKILGWIGVLGGGASALTVVAAGTPIELATGALYMPSLVLIIAFRFWAGLRLWRQDGWPDLKADATR